MTRIIAGAHGGRRLLVPTGRNTRPTTDRVRESLFSRLDHLDVVAGAVVLDLFAGSGALALEALSRGAARAVLVESAGPAARTAGRNVIDLGVDAVVAVSDTARYLRSAAGAGERFDLVFCDPPYDFSEEALAEVMALLVPVLADAAVVVVERSARSPEPSWPEGMALLSSRTHGETALWYAETDTD